jgi:hypothetical protein
VVGCCECGDEPSDSCAMELVSYIQDIEGFTGSVVFSRETFILPLMYQHHFDYKPFRQFM